MMTTPGRRAPSGHPRRPLVRLMQRGSGRGGAGAFRGVSSAAAPLRYGMRSTQPPCQSGTDSDRRFGGLRGLRRDWATGGRISGNAALARPAGGLLAGLQVIDCTDAAICVGFIIFYHRGASAPRDYHHDYFTRGASSLREHAASRPWGRTIAESELRPAAPPPPNRSSRLRGTP